MIFKRKLYDKMLEWKQTKNGKTALLIQEARRVGKSTIAEEFAKNEYESYILIDFAEASAEVHSLFEDISDLDYLFMRLQFIYGANLERGKSVIIFDEVQKQPLARQAIKALVKDRRYHYIETGSLISIKKNVKNIRIPSEETRIEMLPMDYEEFRWALGDTATLPLLQKAFASRQSLSDGVNKKLMRDFRTYMLVGGMPQAVETFLETNNLSLVDQTKREILELYEDDFRKIDSSGNMSKLFDAIPAELSKHSSTYQVFSRIGRLEEKAQAELIADMEDSKTVYFAWHANDPNIGLALNKDPERFKIYMADTGLFITLAFKDQSFTDNIIYEKLLSGKLSADLGMVFENIVAQMLKAQGCELYYYTWASDTSNHLYEVDFLTSKGTKINPIEVKSSSYKTHKSLDMFCEKFRDRISDRYLAYCKDLRTEGNMTFVPMYMMPFLTK